MKAQFRLSKLWTFSKCAMSVDSANYALILLLSQTSEISSGAHVCADAGVATQRLA